MPRLWNPLHGKPRPEHRARLDPYHPTNRGLVAEYLFNEGAGSTWRSTVSPKDDAAAEDPIWTVSQYGMCAGGADNIGTVASGHSWPIGSTARTIIVWIKIKSFADYNLIDYGTTASTGYRCGLVVIKTGGYVGTAGSLAIELTGGTKYTAGAVVAIGEWACLAVITGGTRNTSFLYKNAIPLATSQTGVDATMNTQAGTAYILSDVTGATRGNADLDHLMIYDYQIPQLYLQDLCQHPYGTPDKPRFLVGSRRTHFMFPAMAGSPWYAYAQQ